MNLKVLIFGVSVSTVLAPSTIEALNVRTHEIVNVAAAESPALNTFLQTRLGFLRGVQEVVNQKPVLRWIGEGGIREDDGDRFFRHFHDPLQPWDTAGLQFLGQHESSVRWMQRSDQEWSWQKARTFFFDALTSSNKDNRDQSFADTFRALGQVMHLVVDASVPEHVRNDPHPGEGICRLLFFGLRCMGNYEYWVSDNVGAVAGSIGFAPTLLQQPTGDAQATIPIARLIDSDTYQGLVTGPNVTLDDAIGIAEFANANFFSENTADGSYPFPNISVLQPSQHTDPATGEVRAYYKKDPGDGFQVDPVLAECVLDQADRDEGRSSPSYYCPDERVWEATANVMLPRAVGYARGILDYFFRGKIEITAPDRYAYALAPFVDGNTGSFTKMRFRVRNATEDINENTQGEGEIRAVVQYRTANGNLFENPFAPISPDLSFAVSEPQMVTLTRDFQELTFDFNQSPIPANAADVFLTVVYRGNLGSEDGAVMVGGKDLFEPDPMDFADSTDYDCFQGILYQVSNFELFPPYDPPLHTERDIDQDGIQDIFGPFVDRDMFVKTFDLSEAPPTPSASLFDFSIAEHSFAQYSRFVMLQDRPFYGFSWLIRNSLNLETGLLLPNGLFNFVGNGILNQVFVSSDGQLGRRITPTFTFRGVTTFHATATVNNPPRFSACFGDLLSVSPDLTRVEGNLPAE